MDAEHQSIAAELKALFAGQQEAPKEAPKVAEAPKEETEETEEESDEEPEEPKEEPEAKKAEPEKAPEKAEPDSRIAKVTAASKKLQAERDAWKAEQKAAATAKAELDELRRSLALAKDDPATLARLVGYEDHNQLIKDMAERGQMTPERRRLVQAEQELQEMRSWRKQYEAKEKAAEEARQTTEALKAVQTIAESDPERYGFLLKFPNAFQHALSLRKQHYLATMDPESEVGEELSIEEALDKLEAKLEEDLAPILMSSKAKSKLGVVEKPTLASPKKRANLREEGTAKAQPKKAEPEVDYDKMARELFGLR